MNTALAGVKSAVRVLDLLELLANFSEWLGVSDIARKLGIPKSSAFMLLSTLERRGYVVGNEDRRFRLNPVFANGRSWVGGVHAALLRVARPAMARLAQATGESSFLGVLRDDSSIEYIAKVVGSHDVRVDAELGRARPVHSTSVGMVFLAFQDQAKTERFIKAGPLKRVTARTLCEPRALRQEIAAVRKRGYALAFDTNTAGASGIAAPIFDGSGCVLAALNLSAPSSRFDLTRKQTIAMLLKTAGALSRELSPPTPRKTPKESK